MLGVLLCLSLASCRNDKPPQIIICIGDGAGGADCDIPGQEIKEYWPPSKLENAWITTQEDMAKFASWCYQAPIEKVKVEMDKMKSPTK